MGKKGVNLKGKVSKVERLIIIFFFSGTFRNRTQKVSHRLKEKKEEKKTNNYFKGNTHCGRKV